MRPAMRRRSSQQPRTDLPAAGRRFADVPLDDVRRRIRGSLLAGAVGDALGAPVEFLSLEEIRRRHGTSGVTGYVPAFGRPGGASPTTPR